VAESLCQSSDKFRLDGVARGEAARGGVAAEDYRALGVEQEVEEVGGGEVYRLRSGDAYFRFGGAEMPFVEHVARVSRQRLVHAEVLF
jgi:hypothetical protein